MSANESANWVNAYLDLLKHQRGLSPHTLSNYRLDFQALLVLAADQSLAQLQYFDLRRFTSKMHAQGLHARSIARRLSSWRGFYTWLATQIDLPANPVVGVKAPRKEKSLPKALGVDDAVHLVAQQAGDTPFALANRAMFELLYSSGLRVSELVSLNLNNRIESNDQNPGWIDFEQAEVHVVGKGNKERIVPVGRCALDAVSAWLAVRGQLLRTEVHALFLSERGTRMSVRVVQLRLKQHVLQVGTPAKVNPHVLRHSFATHMLQSSGDLRAVQEMLGHRSISATQVYTALDFQHLAKVYDAAHPRAHKRTRTSKG